MSEPQSIDVTAGDLIEVHGRQGAPARHGMITEVLGLSEHEHYKVRWDEEHESLFFPESGEGVHVVHHKPH
jgi:hypothetical protein